MSLAATTPSISAADSTSRHFALVRTSVATCLGLGIALFFWIDSRYPALLKKLHSGRGIAVKDALSFDALWPVTPAMSLTTRIV